MESYCPKPLRYWKESTLLCCQAAVRQHVCVLLYLLMVLRPEPFEPLKPFKPFKPIETSSLIILYVPNRRQTPRKQFFSITLANR